MKVKVFEKNGKFYIEDNVTIGEKYRFAMEIKTKEKAKAYLKALIEHNIKILKKEGVKGTIEKAKEIELSNIGFLAECYGNEKRKKVYELFNASYPIFGNSYPTI